MQRFRERGEPPSLIDERIEGGDTHRPIPNDFGPARAPANAGIIPSLTRKRTREESDSVEMTDFRDESSKKRTRLESEMCQSPIEELKDEVAKQGRVRM